MAAYPDPSYSTTFGGVSGQDGGWDNSVSMQRSESQSTNCTISSGYTASSSFSGLSSATDYSSAGPAFFNNDEHYFQTSSYQDPSFFDGPENANHILSATGSQYQQSDEHLPQELALPSPSQPLRSQAGIEEAAWNATLVASSLVINQQQAYGGYGPSVITFEAVEEALQRRMGQGFEEPVRPAVQDVLYQQLRPRFDDMDRFHADIPRILEEAAFHLQIRVQGPKVVDICYYAIVTVLAELIREPEADMNAVSSEPVDGPDEPLTRAAPTEKERFRCPYPGCGKAANRQADLLRHYEIVHRDDDQKTKYLCDYRRCPRHKLPFFRRDHFRDHLRDYHKEDLVRRGNKGDDDWWASRAEQALRGDWWRCTRCLVRVNLDEYGFGCPGCGNACEKERQSYRAAMADAELRGDGSKAASSRQRHAAPASSASGRRHAY